MLHYTGTMMAAAALCISLLAVDAHAQTAGSPSDSTYTITVHKSATCGCCEKWVDHLRQHGFRVITRDEDDMRVVKEAHGVPANLTSCHTGLVAGYVIEGHVPADVVAQLLKERPDIAGIAVAGMPLGSPGMEVSGREPTPYEVIAFTKDGKTTVYAKR